MTDKLNPPEESLKDRAHTVVRGVLGAIPIAGTAAVELFTALIVPPLKTRQQQWMTTVAEALAKLQEERRIDLDALQRDESFISLLIEASTISQKTHQEEKRQALRNAVLNRSMAKELDETLQHIFLRTIDELSPLHMRLLKFAHDPRAWESSTGTKLPSLHAGGFSTFIEAAIPELKGHRQVYDRLWDDLAQRGLTQGGIHTTMTGSGLRQSWTKPLGKLFLAFIEAP